MLQVGFVHVRFNLVNLRWDVCAEKTSSYLNGIHFFNSLKYVLMS